MSTNYATLFEAELDSWCIDETIWPQQRTFELFHQLLELECHTVMEDTVWTPIVDEDRSPGPGYLYPGRGR